MLTETERPSQFRVLMRVPRLRHHLPSNNTSDEPVNRPAAELAPPALEYEVTEVTQQVVEDIAVHRGRRIRPAVVAQVLVIILAVVIALVLRRGGAPTPDESPDVPLEIPTVTLPVMPGTPPMAMAEPTADSVPRDGGSPIEITGAPELTLPANSVTDADPLTMIERLPPVSLEIPASAPDAANVSTGSPTAGQETPAMARLENRIETPKPDAHYDSSRPGLY
jgi:hypothetical protein